MPIFKKSTHPFYLLHSFTYARTSIVRHGVAAISLVFILSQRLGKIQEEYIHRADEERRESENTSPSGTRSFPGAIKFTSILLPPILRSLEIRNKIQAPSPSHSLGA